MFNIEEFDIKLDTDFIGRSFVYCDEIDSTNTALLTNKEFQQNGTVFLAENQTKGRGRKDREWYSTTGQNLTFSILVKDDLDEYKINMINFGAAVAVAQALENLCQLNVELKWPNDVLIGGKKIAGILLESQSRGDKLSKIVVGIGINVNQPNFPGRFEIAPTSVKKEFHSTISREKLLSEVLNNFEEQLELAKDDPAKVLAFWKDRCKMMGEKIKIVDDELIKYGIFENVDEDGFLILKVGDKLEKIHFGDVSLR